MRIAFVGKGGSGKTTLSALFAHFVAKKHMVLAVDADLNMHLGGLLGLEPNVPITKHISHPAAVKTIKTYLRGSNNRIKDLGQFRKTTPPTRDSNFIFLDDPADPILTQFNVGENSNLKLFVVGSYESEEIGASCYHNNLAILENMLSHLIDKQGIVVTDMVAGVDAFANTLHAQFDLLVLAVEPTKRGLEVFKQYKELAETSGVYDLLRVVGNKTRSPADEEFVRKYIPKEKLLGFLKESEYLRRKDQEGGLLDVDMLEKENKDLLRKIAAELSSIEPNYQARLENLFDLHRRYVKQAFIAERWGDLASQIDPTFNLEAIYRNHASKNK